MRWIRGLYLLVLLLCSHGLVAQSDPLTRPISISFESATVADVLRLIEAQAPVKFSYDSRTIPSRRIDGQYEDRPLREVLDDVLKGQGLDWEVQGDIVLVLPAGKPSILPSHFVISGYVQDKETGERLIGARVWDARSQQGTITNEAGFFSLRLPADSVKLVVTMLGYAIHGERMVLRRDIRRQVSLLSDLALDAVIIHPETNLDPMAEGGASVVEVPMTELSRLPALMGETDVMSVLKLFPGVHSGGEGSAGIYVRGGGPDQNLVLLDGATVYNSSHLFGFYSIFNSDAIKDVQLVKGGFPARYGGRLSSIVDIQTRDGNLERYEGSFNVGLVSARMSVSGPIVKGKTSIMLSARRTLLEPYFAVANTYYVPSNGNRLGYSFYDLQGKLQQVLGPRDRLLLSGYWGGDRFASGYEIDTNAVANSFNFGLRWSNVVGSLQWRHEWGRQVHSNFSVLYSGYSYSANSESRLQYGTSPERFNTLQTSSGVNDMGGRWAWDWLPNSKQWIRFGVAGYRHRFVPETYSQAAGGDNDTFSTEIKQRVIRSLEGMAYVEDQIKLGKRLNLNLGVHASAYQVDTSFYWSVQPRASLRLSLPAQIGLYGSVTDMVQYIHLLSNSGVGLPTDLWVPATGSVPPQRSQQASMGIDKLFGEEKWMCSVEGYYKRMTNLIDYQTGVNFFGNSDWQDLVEKGGKGSSYGLEVLLRKQRGRLTGWLGYSWSKTMRQFPGINFGEPFPYKYDRRHDFSAVVIYALSNRIELSTNWLYATGNAITFPEAVYYSPTSTQLGFWDLNQGQGPDVIIDYGGRNSFRLPAYHRLDLSMTLRKKTSWGERNWNFGVFNVYNRRNAYFLFLRADYSNNPDSPTVKVRKMSLLPILPEVHLELKF